MLSRSDVPCYSLILEKKHFFFHWDDATHKVYCQCPLSHLSSSLLLSVYWIFIAACRVLSTIFSWWFFWGLSISFFLIALLIWKPVCVCLCLCMCVWGRESSVYWLTSTMPAKPSVGSGTIHELGTLSRSSTWDAGQQVLRPLSTAFSDILTGSWIRTVGVKSPTSFLTWPWGHLKW